VLDVLAIRPAGIYVDATFGRGGHSAAILDRLGPQGRLYAIDRDPQAVAAGHATLGDDSRLHLQHGSFVSLKSMLAQAGLTQRADGILLDLGVSSPQLDDPARGFSFLRDGPVDMRMDPSAGMSAAEWLASAGERELADVIFRYGEERRARRVARAIVEARSSAPIRSTAQLAGIVAGALPAPRGGRHPATRVFQALRIQVNGELEALEAALPQCVDLLAPVAGSPASVSIRSRIASSSAICARARKRIRGSRSCRPSRTPSVPCSA
jgi:16S rRNA (cytosine1402-N4)-methyltransferase